MRMWKINPGLICDQHILGEHFEIHKAVGNLKHSGKWVKALTKKGFLEPQNSLQRHNELVEEMIKRGMQHKSPLNVDGVDFPIGKVDIKKSVEDLIERCENCKKRLR